MSERVWIPLSDTRPNDNEIVFATPDSSGDFVLNNSPVWAAMGFQDSVRVRGIVDFDDWIDGREDSVEWGEGAGDEALPFVTALERRSDRVTLVFEISGSAKEKVLSEISAALGQQCLDVGADGEGIGENTGMVCVPSEDCNSHTDAWRWLVDQFAVVTPELSKAARGALAKEKAWLSIYFANVPQMSTEFVPGLRGSVSLVANQSLQEIIREAQNLEAASGPLSALQLLERSSYAGNPRALVSFMMRAIANGTPGWALAADYWFSIGGFWDEQPSHIDDEDWNEAVELRPTGNVLGGLAHLYASNPAWEPQILYALGAVALSIGEPDFSSFALARSSEMQPVSWVVASLMWVEIMHGSEEKALKIFDSKYDSIGADPYMPGFESNPMFDDVLPLFGAMQDPGFQEEERLNLLSNAGLAYALSGNDEKAVEIWNQASQSAQARLFLAVLPAFNGDIAQGIQTAKQTLSRRDWEVLEGELEEAFGLMSAKSNANFRRWFETARGIQSAI